MKLARWLMAPIALLATAAPFTAAADDGSLPTPHKLTVTPWKGCRPAEDPRYTIVWAKTRYRVTDLAPSRFYNYEGYNYVTLFKLDAWGNSTQLRLKASPTWTFNDSSLPFVRTTYVQVRLPSRSAQRTTFRMFAEARALATTPASRYEYRLGGGGELDFRCV